MTTTSSSTVSTAPIVLGPNQPDRPYRGGRGIAAFRGTPQPDAYAPEDFVGSTTQIHAGGGVGLTRLADGSLLRDAVAADPVGFLGPRHAERLGASTALLVKLLDTQERLFVHFHPTAEFARAHLGEASGKTEAWFVLDVRPDAACAEPSAYVGFTRDVPRDEVARWFESQDSAAMLAAMNRLPLHPGDAVLVPAGIPHAIDPGVTLVELQEPVDLSVLLEYRGFDKIAADEALLGLDPATALQSLDRSAWDGDRLAGLVASRPGGDGLVRLFPEAADRYFRADLHAVRGVRELPAAFAVLVVVRGEGTLGWAGQSTPLTRGMTVLVPYGAGPVRLEGSLDVLACRPREVR